MSQIKLKKQINLICIKKDLYKDVEIHRDIKTKTREFDPGSG